jgi:hypothetical protein
MSQIRCPMCGHLCNGKIEFGSHIKRCQEADTKFKFNPKKNSKKKPKH